MHYVTRRSHRMQKYKFNVTCPGVLFMESTLGPPEHEKECVDISCPNHIGLLYMIHRSHRMQKHKFDVTCLDTLFVESVLVPPGHENIVSTFHAPDAPQCTT
jgi:hypothetical protein